MRRLMLLALLASCLSSVSVGAQAGRWTLLGSRTVTDRADHDTVMVAERGASDLRSAGPERSRPSPRGARPMRATGFSRGGRS